jgi:hypothetical protein
MRDRGISAIWFAGLPKGDLITIQMHSPDLLFGAKEAFPGDGQCEVAQRGI